MREEGWKELNDKFGASVDDKFVKEADEAYKHKYNSYNDLERFYEGYWDSKANHLYYSQSKTTRLYLNIKKVGLFYFHLSPLLVIALLASLYNAK